MRRSITLAGAACGCLTSLLLATGSAGADTQVPLPDGSGQFTAPDGVVVHVDRSGEQATLSGSMAASPLSRNATVSAVTAVHVSNPGGVTVTGGRIETGYLVGCQVDLGHKVTGAGSGDDAGQKPPAPGAGAPGSGTPDGGGADQGGDSGGAGGGGGNSRGGGDSGGGGLSVGNSELGVGVGPSGTNPYSDPNVSVKLKPGGVATKPVQTYSFTGTSGITQYVGHTISIDGCAGYAEARSYTTVLIHDNVMDVTQTLWGKPFSLG